MNNITITKEQFELANKIKYLAYEFDQFDPFDIYELCDKNLDTMVTLSNTVDNLDVKSLEDLKKYIDCIKVGPGCIELLISYECHLVVINDKMEDPNDPDETPFWEKALNKLEPIKEALTQKGYDITKLEEPSL